jgi:hypothetical protein
LTRPAWICPKKRKTQSRKPGLGGAFHGQYPGYPRANACLGHTDISPDPILNTSTALVCTATSRRPNTVGCAQLLSPTLEEGLGIPETILLRADEVIR